MQPSALVLPISNFGRGGFWKNIPRKLRPKHTRLSDVLKGKSMG